MESKEVITVDGKEVTNCQYCPQHHCFWDEGQLDCSCGLSVFADTTSRGIPRSCPARPKEDLH